jgi:ATP-dependent Clp protease adaptor protein ClpS
VSGNGGVRLFQEPPGHPILVELADGAERLYIMTCVASALSAANRMPMSRVERDFMLRTVAGATLAGPAGPRGAGPGAPGGGDDDDNRSGTAIITKTKPRTKRPNLYRVLLLNDDYTPMEFVVHVLERFFNKNREDATRIMLHVHHHGVGECGVFTYEVAETKVTQVMDFARKHQHPLQCVMEKK